jgi:hypothetical protein
LKGSSPIVIEVVPLPFGTAVTIATMVLKSATCETSNRYTTPVVPEITPLVTLNSGLFVVILPAGAVATGALITTAARR